MATRVHISGQRQYKTVCKGVVELDGEMMGDSSLYTKCSVRMSSHYVPRHFRSKEK